MSEQSPQLSNKPGTPSEKAEILEVLTEGAQAVAETASPQSAPAPRSYIGADVPRVEAFEKVTGRDVATPIIEYVERNAKRRNVKDRVGA